jgi:hypothetical protein
MIFTTPKLTVHHIYVNNYDSPAQEWLAGLQRVAATARVHAWVTRDNRQGVVVEALVLILVMRQDRERDLDAAVASEDAHRQLMQRPVRCATACTPGSVVGHDPRLAQ